MNKSAIDNFTRKKVNARNQSKLRNKDFSLIASNCNGAFILHDLGLKFNSPFVNLWIKPKHYVQLLSNLELYMNTDLEFIEEEEINYPVGKLLNVIIYFQHYSSSEEALEKWNKRKERIDYNNLFVMFTERDGCTYSDLLAFDALPFKEKVVFTKKIYPEIKSSVYIKGFENEDEVGNLFEYMPKKIGKKYYDQFDYVTWFNSGKKQIKKEGMGLWEEALFRITENLNF